jgi:DNA helicase-2/ATP-dependent DNA helicase PcrA
VDDVYAPSEEGAPAGQELDFPELNEPQAQAAGHVDGPLLIFAGAGSGKTRVIVYRIANLVAYHRVPPYRILAVTFTNKAAGEMRRRLESLIGPHIARDLWVGTFHAVCARLLRQLHEAAGLERNFVIYDDADQRAVMNRVLKELKLDDKRYPPRQLLSRIHREKQEGRSPGEFVKESYVDDIVVQCYEAYQRHLKSANAVDFDDLLLAVMRIAEDPEGLAGSELRRRFRHVLVDEFQDVNRVQYRLVRALCMEHGNLCVVGDDDQSIYRWRGADVRIVRGFRRDFPDATVVKLEQNYRSTGHIVKAALSVIRSAKEREPKELWTSNKDGEVISVVSAENEHDEAAWVAERIRETIALGVSAGDIAVFYRVHAQSRVLEEVLRAERIPYQIIGGTKFFERAEVKDLLSYLRVVDNPRSDVDLLRVINVPSRKIGETTIEKLVEEADTRRTSLYEAIPPLIQGPNVGGAAKKSLLSFRNLLEGLMAEAASSSPPSALAEEVLERTGYTKMLEQDETAESDARQLNLRELIQSIVDYEQEAAAAGEPGTLAGYLERVTLSSDVDALKDAPKVAMMTVHAAKGLEFHTVFLTGMEEELFPFRGLDPKRGEDVEEERRLAYVALTRARHRLFITHSARRAIFGTTRYGLPSRFITDLPRSSLRPIFTASSQIMQRRDASGGSSGYGGSAYGGSAYGGSAYGGSAYGGSGYGGGYDRSRGPWEHPQARATAPAFRPATSAAPVRPPGERYVEPDFDGVSSSGAGLAPGTRVTHERFGAGVVELVDPGDDPAVTVKFSGFGKKRIKARFLRFIGEP